MSQMIGWFTVSQGYIIMKWCFQFEIFIFKMLEYFIFIPSFKRCFGLFPLHIFSIILFENMNFAIESIN